MGQLVTHDGDTWRVLGVGSTREDGKTYCHLASTTRQHPQRNGFSPVQVTDWVDLKAMPEPHGYANWNPALRGAYRKGFEAAVTGAPATSCPYNDKRKFDGRLTWSRGFRAAWLDGHAAGSAD